MSLRYLFYKLFCKKGMAGAGPIQGRVGGLGFFFALIAAGLLMGCASLPVHRVAAVPVERFPAYVGADGTRISPDSVKKDIPDVDILALSDRVKAILDADVSRALNPKERLDALVKLLIRKVDYDTVADRYSGKTAMEAFETGTANCLSFSNLFVAAARYIGLDARYQEIPTSPNWVKNGGVLFFTRHIGASVDITTPGGRIIELDRNGTTVRVEDTRRYLFAASGLAPFAPEIDPYSVRPISDRRAFAQYYNNIGSKYLADGNRPEAFRYYVKAIETDPRLNFAWSNLGVVYSRNGQLDAALAAYEQGVSVTRGTDDVSLLTILNNMARLYKAKGDPETAATYRKAVAGFREKNPYYHYSIATTAYDDAHYHKSVKQFKEAIERKRDEHLFYYGLALAYLKLGNTQAAEKNFDKAKYYAWSRKNKAYYEHLRETLIPGS